MLYLGLIPSQNLSFIEFKFYTSKVKKSLISLVVPVYNEALIIEDFVVAVLESIKGSPCHFEIIFCVDPSSDNTEDVIRNLRNSDSRIKMIVMSRKFGQAACTLAGIKVSNGEAVIVMDVDLQDPPELIPKLIQEWRQGYSVVLAQRISRNGEPYLKRLISNLGYKFLNRFAEVPIPKNTGDFRLLDKKVVTQLNRFNESNAFLRGLVALVGFKTTTVYFHRPARVKGSTKYNKWLGSFKISLNGVVGYTTALLNLSMFAGIFISFVAFFVGATYGFSKLMGGEYPIGNPTIVISILAMGGLNLFFLGILGMYVSKIYEEVKSRPSFIIEDSVGFEDIIL